MVNCTGCSYIRCCRCSYYSVCKIRDEVDCPTAVHDRDNIILVAEANSSCDTDSINRKDYYKDPYCWSKY